MLATTLQLVLSAADMGFEMFGACGTEDKKRFLRFLISGGVNTLFGFAIYSVFILSGAEVWLALISGTVIGVLFNFFTTSGFVFRELSIARVPRFLLCYALIYAINLHALHWLSTWLSDKIISQAILVLPIAALSYFLMKKIVFVVRKE